MIRLPPTLEGEIDALVAQGVYGSRDEAAADLVRLGLEALRARAPRPGPPSPTRPPAPPGVGRPGDDDRPISVDPRDTKWVE